MGWKRTKTFSIDPDKNKIYIINVNKQQFKYTLEAKEHEQQINDVLSNNRYGQTSEAKHSQNKSIHPESTLQKIALLFSGFVIIFITAGFAFNMSVLNNEWMLFFKKSKAETALIQSICIGILNCAGFPSGLAVSKIGPKKSGIVGGLLVAVGLTLSFFATSIGFLISTIGILTGLGISLSMNSSLTSISQHFHGKQTMLALSFVSFGSGVGAICFPVLIQQSIESFEWHGTLLIIGGLSLNIPVCSILYKNTQSDNSSKTKVNVKPSVSIVQNVKDLLSNKLFLCFVIAFALNSSALSVIPIFLVDFLESNGMSRTEAVDTYFIMTISTTIFRLLPGILKQIPRVSVFAFPVVFSSIGCFALVLLPLFTSNVIIKSLVGIYGAALGGITTLTIIIVLKVTSYNHYSTAIGINGAVTGLACLAAGPISGHFRDMTGNYALSLFTAGATFGLASLIFSGLFIYKHKAKGDPLRSTVVEEFEMNI